MRILIAEDDPVNHELLKSLVTDWGYAVVAVHDGAQAWEHLRREGAPSVAVLDWMMPKMTGPEVVRSVRALSLPIQPFLLLLSSRDENQDVVASLRGGASDYLVKPFNVEELQVRIEIGIRGLASQKQAADRVRELEAALAQTRRLQGVLPICVYCKKIRDEADVWQEIENHLFANAGVHFSHSVCPGCVQQARQPGRAAEPAAPAVAKPKGIDPGRAGAVATPLGPPTGKDK